MDKQKDNIFKILRVENHEIIHSNFLAWLFKRKIKGKNVFLECFLQDLKEQLKDQSYEEISKSFSQSNGNISIKREEEHIDILIYNSESVICIENKWGASESAGQLDKYYNYVEKNYSDRNIRKYIFLTLKDKKPTHDKRQSYNYGPLKKEVIEKGLSFISERKEKEIEKQKLYINDYLDIFKKKEKDTTKQIEFFEELQKELRKNGFSNISCKGSNGIYFMPNGFEGFPCDNKRSAMSGGRSFACDLYVKENNHLTIGISLFKCDLKNKDDSIKIKMQPVQKFYKKIEQILNDFNGNGNNLDKKTGGVYGRWHIGKKDISNDFLNDLNDYSNGNKEAVFINIIEKIEHFLNKYDELFEKLQKIIPLSS